MNLICLGNLFSASKLLDTFNNPCCLIKGEIDNIVQDEDKDHDRRTNLILVGSIFIWQPNSP